MESSAFVDVNVLPMNSERVIENQTVLINDGRIAAIGPAGEISLPPGCEVIQCDGAYLMPGLADMHVHLSDFDPNPEHLILYIAHGVTTLRSLNTPWKTLNWRQMVNAGKSPGPRIFLSGPSIAGVPPDAKSLASGLRVGLWFIFMLVVNAAFFIVWLILSQLGSPAVIGLSIDRLFVPWLIFTAILGTVLIWQKILPIAPLASLLIPQATIVETAAQARSAVKKQKKAGVDFIKPYDFLTRETYFVTIRAAQENQLYTAGHIPDNPEVISVREAITGGQNEVVHMDEFSHEFWPKYAPKEKSTLDWDVDMSGMDEIAALAAEHGVAVTATLITNEIVLLGLEDLEATLQKPEYKYVHPKKIVDWRSQGRFLKWQGQEKYRREEWRPLLMQLTKAMHEKGVTLLTGTDMSVEGIVPGFSIHQELELLVEAGLSPYDALCCGTRNAAIVADRMGKESDWGTIAAGNQADLILLSENPLTDIRNTCSQLGVMVRGKWYPQTKLDRMVEDFIANYDK